MLRKFGSSPFRSDGSTDSYDTLSYLPSALTSPSVPLESGNISNSNYATISRDNSNVHGNYDVPLIDRDHFDDISTDDPYTYSDDSASLSDAYFRQQPSPDSGPGYFSFLSLTSSEREDGEWDSRSRDSLTWSGRWSGPPLFPSDDSVRSSRRNSDREKRRYLRQLRQERSISISSTSSIDEEPITERTSLLDMKGTAKIMHDDRNHPKDQKFIGKSSAHRQHRKKHELRKHKRYLLLQEQQKRQEERERLVAEVRGKHQSPSIRRDRFWLVLFILQLLLVCLFAIKYAFTFYSPSTNSEQVISNITIELDPAEMPSMLMTGVENDNPAIRSEIIDSPISEFGYNNISGHATEAWNPSADVQDKLFTIDYKNVLSILLISGTYACITSYLSFAFMLILARSIIPIMLVFTLMLFLSWGIFGLTIDTNTGSITSLGGFALFGLSFAYTMSNWNQISFCSTNLYTAICAMRSSIGILLVGIASLFVGLFWLLIWTVALMGIFNRNNSTDCKLWDECETHVYIYRGRIIELGLLLVSLYWTTMVIKNILRVTVAGAIGGRWWFAAVPGDIEAASQQEQRSRSNPCCACCSKSIVSDPLARACTSSLGTICFGSLVEFPAQLLSKLVTCLCWFIGSTDNDFKATLPSEHNDTEDGENSSRDGTSTTDSTNTNGSITPPPQKQPFTPTALRETYLQRLNRGLQSCNRWSYTYIGMYNYSFREGGEKAIQLFETREWMDIARDTLIQKILFMASIVIGGSSGMVAVLVEEVDGYEFTSLHKPITTSFLIGFFLGFILSNILLLGMAASAVNTVLVCFAAEPFSFDRNHPHLSREMREVWSQQVWEPDGHSG